jgi:haloacetate dehalogenase
MDESKTLEVEGDGTTIHVRIQGSGCGLLLLHGFPQTHAMWRDIAPLPAQRFTVVCADLRGYGRSGCPPSTADHAPYAKRAMAKDMVAVMVRLGFERFLVAGHDRGGRVAYRMALDHPAQVERLAVLDVIPGIDAWDRADARFALAFWPWSLLAQPEPLPESLLTAGAQAIVKDALEQWDTPASAFPPAVRRAYELALKDPQHAHAICEEYRAAATLDREHDRADRDAGRRIACPVLVLWSAKGALENWYRQDGGPLGPLGLWNAWADDVQGLGMDAGHFFPEEQPQATAEALMRFFAQ